MGGLMVIDFIGVVAVLLAVWLVVSATPENAQVVAADRKGQRQRLLLAVAIAAAAIVVSVLRLADAASTYVPVVTGFVGGATIIAASVVRSATKVGDPSVVESSLPPSGLARFALFVVRLGLAGAALVVLVVFAFEEERKIDDRVAIQRGWSENGPLPKKPGERQYYGFVYHDDVHLTLTITTPRTASLCPMVMTKIREERGGDLFAERPSKCAAGRELQQQYGAEPIAAVLRKDVYGPPASISRRIDAVVLAGFALYLLAGFAVERLLRRASQGRPFDRSGARWIWAFTGAVAGITVVIPVLADVVVGQLVDRYLPGVDSGGWSVSLWQLVPVLVLGTLGEIWRRGAALQAEADGTV